MTFSGVAPGAMLRRSSDDSGPATCSGSSCPAFAGDEQATAKTLRLAFGAQRRREIRLRLDEHPGPALLLQMPGLRALTRIVGADLDVIAFDISEEGGHQPRFLVGRKARQGRNFQPERDFGARVRSTIELVEWPGTRSIRMISPPSASTISRPTTCSRV